MDKKILVAYFSRADENYSVGTVDKGNTEIAAEIIASLQGGDLFKIETVKEYSKSYNECIAEAKDEMRKNERPALKTDLQSIAYDTIFLGYPNWWSDMPMAVYTFLEAHDFSGKTVAPFCTNEGSGLSSTVKSLKKLLKNATVTEGLSLTGHIVQNSPKQAEKEIKSWISDVIKEV